MDNIGKYMSYIVHRLTGTDWFLKSIEIAKLKSKVSGTKRPSELSLEESFSDYFDGADRKYVLGCLDGDNLISWLAFAFFENKTRGKFWCISALYTTKFTSYFSFNNPEISLLIKTAFEIAESKNYYEYYYSVSSKISKVYERQIKKNTFMQLGRYNMIELDIIPPNTKPTTELYWKLMGQEIKPDSIIIKKRVLKQEYRKK